MNVQIDMHSGITRVKNFKNKLRMHRRIGSNMHNGSNFQIVISKWWRTILWLLLFCPRGPWSHMDPSSCLCHLVVVDSS